MKSRITQGVLAAGVVLAIGAGSVSAATTLVLDPDRATPGTRVTVLNACLGVTDHPPARPRVALVPSTADNQDPSDPSVPKTKARRIDLAPTYVFTVPNIPPGEYQVRFECVPDGWTTNTAEGAAMLLTVIAGPPATSTLDVEPKRSTSGWPIELVTVVGLGLLGGLVAARRARR